MLEATGASAVGTHLLVEPVSLDARTASGIRVPSGVKDVCFGRVRSVGMGVELAVGVGEVVCFLEKFSVKVMHVPESLVALRADRVIAVVSTVVVDEAD